MPELPEVERGRRLAESVAKGRKIRRAVATEDRIVCEGRAPAEIESALVGRRVIEVLRHGKQLWFELDRPPHPLFHFGMTGGFQTPNGPFLALETGPRKPDATWPPRFTKLVLTFEGGELAFTDARRLGRLRLRNVPREESPLSDLGFDPLLAMPRAAEFARLVFGRRLPLKCLLLDQSFAAGIGNWLADEILYQARLDPRRSAHSLTTSEVRRLHHHLKRIVAFAVSVNAEKDQFPKTWLFHHRWGKQKGAKTARGEAIEHLTLGGRTTAWVPKVQDSASVSIGSAVGRKDDPKGRPKTRASRGSRHRLHPPEV